MYEDFRQGEFLDEIFSIAHHGANHHGPKLDFREWRRNFLKLLQATIFRLCPNQHAQEDAQPLPVIFEIEYNLIY